MSGVVEFEIVFDGSGDPAALREVMPRCHGCGRMLQKQVVKETLSNGQVLLWHKSCFLTVPTPSP